MSQYESHALRRVCAGGLLAFLGVYALLEKKKLPWSWWRPLSRFYFFPMAVPLYLARLCSGGEYFTDVDEGVLLGAVPMRLAGHIAALHRDGVRAVVNLQAEYMGPTAAYERLGISQLHMPIVDHTEPTLEQLEQAVEYGGGRFCFVVYSVARRRPLTTARAPPQVHREPPRARRARARPLQGRPRPLRRRRRRVARERARRQAHARGGTAAPLLCA